MIEFECQARICPICHDDHSEEHECNPKWLRWRVEELIEFRDRTLAALLEKHTYTQLYGAIMDAHDDATKGTDGRKTTEP